MSVCIVNVEKRTEDLSEVLRQEVVQSAENYHAATEEARVAEKERVLAVQKRAALLDSLRRSFHNSDSKDSESQFVNEQCIQLIREGSAKVINEEVVKIQRKLKHLKKNGKLSSKVHDLLIELDGSFARYIQDKRLLERIEKTIEATTLNPVGAADTVSVNAETDIDVSSNLSAMNDLAERIRREVDIIVDRLIRQLKSIQSLIHSAIQMEETLRAYFFSGLAILQSSFRDAVVVRHRGMMRSTSIEKRCSNYKILIADLIQSSPNIGEHLHHVARTFAHNAIQQGEVEEAKSDLLTALYFVRDNEETLRLLVKVLRKLGESELAFTAQQTLLQLCPNDIELRKEIAAEWVNRTKFNEAIRQYDETLQVHPDDLAIRRELGRLLFEVRDHERIPGVLKEYLQLNPHDAECLLWMGSSLVLLERWGEAIPYLKRCIERQKHCWKTTFLLATAYRKLKFYNEALNLIEPFRNLEHSAAQASMIAGDMLQERGDFAEAEQAYLHAKTVRGASVSLARALGQAQCQQGKSDQAVVNYHESVRLDAHATDALVDIGRILRQKQKFEEAERMLVKALEQRPDFPEARQELAVVYSERGEWDKAAEALQSLVPQSNPSA